MKPQAYVLNNPRKKVVPVATQVTRGFLVLLLSFLSVAWILPVLATLLTAFRSFDSILTDGFLSLSGGLSLDNFVRV